MVRTKVRASKKESGGRGRKAAAADNFVVADDDGDDDDDDAESEEGGDCDDDNGAIEEADEDGSDEDVEEAMKKSAAYREYKKMGKSERERKISDVVRCVLALNANGSPIRRENIKADCFSEERDKVYSRALNVIVHYASCRLDKVFGMKLVDIAVGKTFLKEAAEAEADRENVQPTQGQTQTQTQDGATKARGGAAKVWVVMNTLSYEQKNVSLALKDEENAVVGLLMFLLAFIHMKDNSLLDADLVKYLKPLGVYPGKKHHEFGDVMSVIKEFVKERFIVSNKATDKTGKTTYEYQWGPRAYKELTTIDVYEFVAQIMGDDVDTSLLKKLEIMKRNQQQKQGIQQADDMDEDY